MRGSSGGFPRATKGLSGVSATRIIGCRAAAIRHFLGGFLPVSLAVYKLHRVNIVGVGEELCWLGDILKINFCDLVNLLEFLDVSL